ncbi:site-2 protease family protein [Candidatus Micrarchaeota archaeon]|nr:site-2 protease family protein [Candidatus Micrarchaeota archaeon]
MNFKLDFKEVIHILGSVLIVSLAFTLFPVGSFTLNQFWIVLATLGIGFVLHELAHKFVALRYGAQARYEAWTTGLVFALFLSFITEGSIIFAAPGAVKISGKLSREQYGKTALAGPLTNLLLALGFLISYYFGFFKDVALTGVYVNSFLGAFNMLPFGIFDGAKVMAWDKRVWLAFFLIFVASLLLMF